MSTDKRHRFPPDTISYAIAATVIPCIGEVFVKINGKQYYLWRAVDQDECVQ